MLFAAIGLAIGGVDDLLIDLIYIVRRQWRKATVYSRYPAMTTATLPPSDNDAPLAIFIPAWQEAAVIERMLSGILCRWGEGRYRIFVGVYPNDPDTLDALMHVATDEPRIVIAINPLPGPTTKADNLNSIWSAMLRDEGKRDVRYKAVVLHDAEDVVHPDELKLLSCLIDRFALVQLPVLPLQSQQSQWIAGHYLDEFAESHGKALAVREAVGAAMPSAGVGCAFARGPLVTLAAMQGGKPFDADSLTEDYEIGLRISELGGTGIFVEMHDAQGQLVCTREHFPETRHAAVRQKARWMTGIALSGWDRLGWHGGLAEHWMRLRDRRAALAALILFAAYVALLLYAALNIAVFLGLPVPPASRSPLLDALLWVNGALMGWRAMMRYLFVSKAYGWREGMRSIPRTIVANFIAILAARHAIAAYLRVLRGAPPIWEKTAHRYPDEATQT